MSVPVSSFKDRLKELLEMRNMKQIDLVKLTQENAKTYGKALTRSMVSRYFCDTFPECLLFTTFPKLSIIYDTPSMCNFY